MYWKHAILGAAIAIVLLLGSASQPRAAPARTNAPDAISNAQITVNAILLGQEFSIFYGGFEY